MNRQNSLSYMPGLDGLRALAVVAVIVYHANKSWLTGGFLGVEVFFVISGYLITLLLITESEQNDRISFKQFWLRRARRLLPALWALLLGVCTYASLFMRDELGKLRGDVIAAFVYGFNWFKIWSKSSYFDSAQVDPLRHLWSLAVEEQFYLVWPLLIAAVLRIFGKRLVTLGGIFFVTAVGVAWYVAATYAPGFPEPTALGSPDHYVSIFGQPALKLDFLFLGTLGRSGGLFLGAALAFWYRPSMFSQQYPSSDRHAVSAIGAVGLVALGVMMWRFQDVYSTTVDLADGTTEVVRRGYDPLFQGGFLLVGLASIAVITAAVHPHSPIGTKLLGNPIFTYLGRRSYGLYLYHWPVFRFARGADPNPMSIVEFILLALVILAITEASYRFIEMPIRTGEFSQWWFTMRHPRNEANRKQRQNVIAIAVVVSVLPLFGLVSVAIGSGQGEVAESLKANEQSVQNLVSPTTVAASPGDSTATTTLDGQIIPILAIGDSVMLGAANVLTERGITVDALKSRPFRQALEIANYVKSINRLGDFVIIHLGTNNYVDEKTLDEIMVPLTDVDRVVMLTTHVPKKPWQDPNNELIRAMPNRYGNVTVLDWYTIAQQHPEYLYSDKIHLNPEGQAVYADLIMQAIGS